MLQCHGCFLFMFPHVFGKEQEIEYLVLYVTIQMHNEYFCSNHPSYILCHTENNITSILCFKTNEIVQNFTDVVVGNPN